MILELFFDHCNGAAQNHQRRLELVAIAIQKSMCDDTIRDNGNHLRPTKQ